MSHIYADRKRPDSAAQREDTAPQQPSLDALRAGTAKPTAEQMGHRVDLPDAMRSKMEDAFGADLGAVKLYESRTVADAGANAVSQGANIAFAPGLLDFSSYEGQALLDWLAAKYNDRPSWEARKAILRADIRHAVGLDKVPEHFDGKLFLSKKRSYANYSVQDLALEILPGLYCFGAVYWPKKMVKGGTPVVINPHGHFALGHAQDHVQQRCAMQAQMGCIAISYSMFCYGPTPQFDMAYHKTGLSQPYDILCAERLLDYAFSLKETDPSRIGITGCSGGGSQSMFVTAIDDRITLSIPVVMMSSYFAGGCDCESGTLIHRSAGGTGNVEIASMCAPRPMLIISDGGDWTAMNPEIEIPFVQRTYGFYGAKDKVEHVHFPMGQHNYDAEKRAAAYEFLARNWNLKTDKLRSADGKFDESGCVVEKSEDMNIWNAKGISKPDDFVTDIDKVVELFHWEKNAR